jgi:hypothetical protein
MDRAESTDMVSISASSFEMASGISFTAQWREHDHRERDRAPDDSVNLKANFEGTVPSHDIISNFENATSVSVPGWQGRSWPKTPRSLT